MGPVHAQGVSGGASFLPQKRFWGTGQGRLAWGQKASSHIYFKTDLGLAVGPEPILSIESNVGAAEPGVPDIPSPPSAIPPQARMLAGDTTHVRDWLWGYVMCKGWEDGKPHLPRTPLKQPEYVICHIWCSELRRLRPAVLQGLRASGGDPGAGSAPWMAGRGRG